MHSDQVPYAEVYEQILDYDGSELYADVVKPWAQLQQGEREWLDRFGKRAGTPVPEATIEDSWHLYALSRIIDLLQLGLGPAERNPKGGWGTMPIRHAEHVELMDLLGLTRVARSEFHPFFHEIVTVEPLEDRAAPITIVNEHWPAYMLGPLLITRAGCAVAAGEQHLKKEIAESSTLYWAYARRNRPTFDLSNGWGSNSAWRTRFRRDYALDGMLHYNVDARRDHRQIDDDLTPAERLELLRFRSFVLCPKEHHDRWPYDDSYQDPIG